MGSGAVMTINEQLCVLWGLIAGLTGRKLFMKNLIAKVLSWFSGDLVQKIIKSIPQIVSAVEQDYINAIADGKITSDERKNLAMKTINAAADVLGMKMNFITKWIISTIVDNIAKKLPSKDLDISGLIKIAQQVGV